MEEEIKNFIAIDNGKNEDTKIDFEKITDIQNFENAVAIETKENTYIFDFQDTFRKNMFFGELLTYLRVVKDKSRLQEQKIKLTPIIRKARGNKIEYWTIEVYQKNEFKPDTSS